MSQGEGGGDVPEPPERDDLRDVDGGREPGILPKDGRLELEDIEAMAEHPDEPSAPAEGWNEDEPPPQLLEPLAAWLRARPTGFVVTYPCTMIGFAQSYVDVAHDFLVAAFIGERLAPLARTARPVQNRERRPRSLDIDFAFTLDPNGETAFAAELIDLTRRLGSRRGEWGDNGWEIIGLEDLGEFEDRLWGVQRALHAGTRPEWGPRFPSLCDDWLFNFLTGPGDAEWTEEDVLRAQPSFADGYTLSFVSAQVGGRVYLGAEAWLTDLSVTPSALLDDYTLGGTAPWPLVPAWDVRLGDAEIAVSGAGAHYVPRAALRRAQRVAHRCLRRPHGPRRIEPATTALMSENGRLLVLRDTVATYYFFDEALRPVPPKALAAMAEGLDAAADAMRALIGRPRDLAVPWDQIDEDVFERLCYDLVVREFDPTQIQLMGRTRARDGGRDITFTTAALAGREPTRWVAQCKFTRSKQSIGTRDVQDVGDMLDQYGATGYVLFTNVVIDSALTDRLKPVTEKRGVAFRTRAGQELEHLLARYREVRQRYFPES